MAQLTWVELQQAIADRLRETEDLSGTIPVGEPDIPYYSATDIETSLLEVSTEMLCEIPEEELDAIGSDAMKVLSSTISPIAVPLNMLKVVSMTIIPSSTGSASGATQPLAPALWVANQNVDPKLQVSWSVFNGGVYFTGYSGKVVFIVAPPLSTWRSPTSTILPDGYDEERIDRAVKQLQIANFEPQGGI